VLAVRVDEYRDGVLIATTRKELHVNVANCAIAAARLPLRITNCDDFTVAFANESTSPAILSYFWDFGVPNISSDTSTAALPTYTYPDTGVYIAKLIVNRGSTCSDSATTEVRVFPGFFPGFVVDGSCFSNPFDFRDTTHTRYGVVNFWRWDFGNPAVLNDTSLLRNPSYTYPSPGTYNATLIVGSSKGCLDTVAAPVTVIDRPLLTLSPDTLKCSPDTIQLLAVGRGNFTWDPSPTLLDRFSATPRVFPRDTTTYYVTLNDRGCIARDSIRVNVLEFISVDAGPDTTICRTDVVRMRPTSFATTYQWTPAALFSDPTAKFAEMLPVDATTRVYVTANLGTCQDRDSLLVRTVPYPQAAAGPDTTICFGAFATLRGTAVAAFYNWTPAGQVVNPTQLVTNTRTLTSTTSFTLTVRDTLGCPKPVSDVVQVTVRPRINLFAGNDTSVVINQPLQLNAISNGLQFNWSPGTGLSSTSIANPVALFGPSTLPTGQESVRYVVTASTPEGCAATDDIVVRIFKTAPSIFVPNAFTPNRDGLNDVIRPILAGIQRLDYFRIYNRYGQLVYETRQSGAGWDGRLRGIEQASGAYVYQCQAQDYLGNTIRTKGTFVLLR
jgi:gliding motility-associated-like protein